MKTKPGPSTELIAYMQRQRDIKAGLIPPDEPIPPPQKKPEARSVSGYSEKCYVCRWPCDISDCDKEGNSRCRRCGIAYLDDCRVKAIESHAKERKSKK